MDAFISKILVTLIIQLVITFLVMKNTDIDMSTFQLVMATIGMIVLFLIIMLSSLPIYIKFFIFSIISVVTGMMLSKVKNENVNRAIWGTIGIFASMFILGLFLAVSGYNLSFLGIFLFVALSVLVIVQIVSIFYPMSDNMTKIWTYIGLTLFSFYVIYDINVIKVKKPFGDDYVASSIGLYLDFINIFANLLRLGSR